MEGLPRSRTELPVEARVPQPAARRPRPPETHHQDPCSFTAKPLPVKTRFGKGKGTRAEILAHRANPPRLLKTARFASSWSRQGTRPSSRDRILASRRILDLPHR